jgi:hypothetical protein
MGLAVRKCFQCSAENPSMPFFVRVRPLRAKFLLRHQIARPQHHLHFIVCHDRLVMVLFFIVTFMTSPRKHIARLYVRRQAGVGP